MKDFKRLVQIVTKRGQKNIPLLYFNKDIEAVGKEQELFLKTQSGDFSNDKDASMGIYGTEVPDHRYKMLKSRVKQKLLNHVYFLDYDDERVTSSHKYEEECLRLIYISRILMNEGEFYVSEKLLNKCLYLAKEAEFTYIIISSLELLRLVHTENCRPIHFKKTKEDIRDYKKIYEVEEEARETFYFYKILLSKSGHSRRKNIDKVETAIKKLKSLYEKNNSYQIFEQYYNLKILYLQLNGNYNEIIKLTNEVDQEYEKGSLNVKRFDNRYNKLVKIYAHLNAKDYTNGLKYAEKYISEFSKSSQAWFSFMENYFLLAMHTKSYELASNIINKVMINSFYDKLPERNREKWDIYRGYLYFLSPDDSLVRNYDFNKYFAEVPVFRKDKSGYNSSILILQFLNYLKEDKVGRISEPVEELDKYVNKYCTDCFSKRSKVFFKLLSTVVKCGLDIRTIKVKTKYLSSKLKEIDVAGDIYDELEVLPYEQLWDIIIKYLKINEVKAEL
ncbi:MAG: hypothetical protein ACNS62_05220 [Candidatus Cyclobacteriaceae bacterium M3_2C_046]